MYKRTADIVDRGIIQGIPCMWPAVLVDNFEGAFNWHTYGTGAGWVSETHADAAFTGLKGLRLKTRVTGAAVDDEACARLKLFRKPGRILRVQIATRNAATDPSLLTKVIPCFYDGTYEYHCDIYLDYTLDSAGYLVPDNAGYAPLYPAGWDIYSALPCWTFIDIRVDMHSKTWHSLAINGFHKDVHDQLLFRSDHAYPPYIQIALKATTRAAESVEAHFDNLLVTCEEP